MSGTLRFIAGGDLLRWIAGPILEKELRVASRRRRNFILRFAYLVLLSTFAVMMWLSIVLFNSGSPSYRASQMAVAGLGIVSFVLWFQFITLPLISVVMLSGSISEEVHRRTLGVLMTTPITSRQIVLGKLAGRLLQILLLLAISLPLLCVVRVFGGVPWDYVMAGLCVTLAFCLFAASLTMFFSISGRRVYSAIMKSVLTMALLFLLVPLVVGWLASQASVALRLAGAVRAIPWVGGWLAGLVGETTVADAAAVLLFHANPYFAMFAVSESTYTARGPTGGMGPFSWPVHCAVMLGASAVLLALCVWKVRRVALAEITGDTPRNRRLARRAARSAVRVAEGRPPRIARVLGPPMIWKELRTRFYHHRLRALLGALFAVGLLLLTYLMSAESLREPIVHSFYVVALMVVGILATTVLGAIGITAEKEAGTWSVLLGTSLSADAIVLGKAVGAVGRAAPVWLLLALHLAIFYLAGYVHPILFLHLGMIVAGLVALLVGAGLFLGACFRRTVTAVAVNLCFALLVWAGLPVPLLILSRIVNADGYVAGLYLTLHPMVQAVIATQAASGNHAPEPLGTLSYNLPWHGFFSGAGEAGVGVTTAIIGATMLAHMLLGVLFAFLATRMVRKVVF